MTVMAQNRRKEERVAAAGSVLLRRLGLPRMEVAGQLQDESASGFRAAYTEGMLSSGDEVEFVAPSRSGNAVVVWSRVFGHQKEAGFLIRRLREGEEAGSGT